jgi:D-tyrosyl-tRNA(Tyr) deacylase|tara:strand:+ start:216 stop:671 length:456 start_codon:yes stop_codon:yes gene_type:complete
MKVVIQRVDSSSVTVSNEEISSINNGLLLLWGIEVNDTIEDVNVLTEKILNLRIFSDEEGKMNKSIVDVGGSILLVSQFTLLADVSKGNRPSFIKSENPDNAKLLLKSAIKNFSEKVEIKEGEFGAFMKVELINDGPVTILLEAKNGKLQS